ncbi:exocyst complex component EXO70A1-like, partial [Trifolium medium]|nr:exocyst complex component EXO70A1-like [Trifolium medium]
LILERLTANNHLDSCVSIYTEVRTLNFQATFQALDFNDLETTTLSEFDSFQSIESCIEKWSDYLEYAVKHLLELEYRASNAVFNKEIVGLDVSNECFAKTVVRSALLQGFVKFANTITKGKKEAIKLLKLLNIFASLNKLRVDFNRFFGGKNCVEIQSQMRDFIKKVINEACDIFWELPTQVESQRQSTPPADGGIPRLLSFVVDYSNELLGEYYRPILTQILEIQWSWNNNHTHKEGLEKQRQQFLLNQELHYKKIIKALELNI